MRFSGHTPKQQTVAKYNLMVIFEATFRLSAQLGNSKLTVRDLQSETDLSMGSLYKCFSTKAHLENMLFEGMNFITQHAVDALNQDLKNKEPNFELAIKGHLYVSEFFKSFYQFIFKEASRIRKKI